MPTELEALDITLIAGADLSAKQFHIVYLNAARTVTFATAATQAIIGVLQNKPDAAGKAAVVRVLGISKVKTGGIIAFGAHVTATADGTGISTTTEGDVSVGRALDAAASGDVISVLLVPNPIGT